jgi:hypothetical protein
MGGNKKAFVLMPFHSSFESYYRSIYTPALVAAGYAVTRADENIGSTPIMLDVQESILKADLILCEMSGKNPNVFYELGLAHAIGKRVILLSKKKSDIPFDLQHVRAITYDSTTKGWEDELREDITAYAKAIPKKIWPPPLIEKKLSSLTKAVIVLILLLTGSAIFYFTRSFHQREYRGLLERGYKETAQQVKARFEERFMGGARDDKLTMSYWHRHGGILYQVATTEDRQDLWRFPDNKMSIIGCAFAYPNRFVEWDNKDRLPVISSYIGERSPDGGTCQFGAAHNRDIKYIACSSYNGTEHPDANPEYTVGICVFTESDNNILSYNYREFLKDRTEEFYESVKPLITNKKLFPR